MHYTRLTKHEQKTPDIIQGFRVLETLSNVSRLQ